MEKINTNQSKSVELILPTLKYHVKKVICRFKAYDWSSYG